VVDLEDASYGELKEKSVNENFNEVAEKLFKLITDIFCYFTYYYIQVIEDICTQPIES